MFIILQGVTIHVFVVIWAKEASCKILIQKKNGWNCRINIQKYELLFMREY